MLLMLFALLTLGISGFLMQEVDALWGADWPQQIHETTANGLLGLACMHVLAALFESALVRDNLPLSMLTGRRKRLPDERAQ